MLAARGGATETRSACVRGLTFRTSPPSQRPRLTPLANPLQVPPPDAEPGGSACARAKRARHQRASRRQGRDVHVTRAVVRMSRHCAIAHRRPLSLNRTESVSLALTSRRVWSGVWRRVVCESRVRAGAVRTERLRSARRRNAARERDLAPSAAARTGPGAGARARTHACLRKY